MKSYIKFIFLIFLLNSCNKKEIHKTVEQEKSSLIDSFNIHQIETIKGVDSNTQKEIEVQIYQSLDKNKFLNQVIEYHKNGQIDSINSRFYRLDFKEISKDNYKGRIWLNYENEKINEIELKVLTYEANEPLISNFISNNSNEISFEFLNVNSEAPLIGVLCLKIETEIVIDDKKDIGYFKRYIFVDSNDLTDNLFIKQYKN